MITKLFILVLFSSLFIIFKFYLRFYSYIEYIQNYSEYNNENFDYIIVGSGTAGSLIAHRLIENENITFAILEAGGSGGPMLNPPIIGPLLQESIHDWQYSTTAQINSCFAMKENKCKWPSGKIIGGSSKLNNMIHIRKFIKEIIPWFNYKYTQEDIYKQLNKIENLELNIESLRFKTSLGSSVLNAALELNYTILKTDDISDNEGFMEPVVNQKNGAKWTTSHAFLSHYLNKNKLISNAFVTKILFDSDKKIANGVIFERYGSEFKLFAKKGIILTAGAIGTPKLLMLSGIGPQDHINEMQIELVKNLPVGQNLMDHVSTGLDLLLLNKSSINLKDVINPINAFKYYFEGNGIWTFPGCETIAFLKTYKKSTNFHLPDLQFMILPMGVTFDYGIHFKNIIGIKDKVWKKYFKNVQNSATVLTVLLHPKSFGEIKLQSKNPSDQPLINPNYFSDEYDIEVMIKGIEIIKKILRTKSMKNLDAQLNPVIFPGCEQFQFNTYNYWKCYIKHLTLTTFHPAGTCRIGDDSNNSSVINYNFEVIGIKNLFIADASIFPTMPSGNINSAVAITAGLLADYLLTV